MVLRFLGSFTNFSNLENQTSILDITGWLLEGLTQSLLPVSLPLRRRVVHLHEDVRQAVRQLRQVLLCRDRLRPLLPSQHQHRLQRSEAREHFVGQRRSHHHHRLWLLQDDDWPQLDNVWNTGISCSRNSSGLFQQWCLHFRVWYPSIF